MKSVQERLLVVAYTSNKCFFSARSAPLLEEINTKMVKYADFARVNVDSPTFRSLCSEEVRGGFPGTELATNLVNLLSTLVAQFVETNLYKSYLFIVCLQVEPINVIFLSTKT